MLQHAESHCCEVNIFGIIACDFCMFLRFLKGVYFRKSLTESERCDRLESEKFLKIIEHIGYSVRYCQISWLMYSGSSSLSKTCRFHFSWFSFYISASFLEN